MTSNNDGHWRTLGFLFGYPPCCINAFCIRADRFHRNLPVDNEGFDTPTALASWSGTGFVPCSVCRPEAEANWPRFVAERITPNRTVLEPLTKTGK